MSAALKTAQQLAQPQAKDPSILEKLAHAQNVLAPVWPLKSFIACNPLQGFEDLPFETATAKAFTYQKINQQPIQEREHINREMIKWLGAFLDEGQATIPMPNRSQGFYKTFAQLARFDQALHVHKKVSTWLAALPESAEAAITECFARLSIAPAHQEEFMRQSLAALPGWSGYVKWRSEWQNPSAGTNNPINMLEYVAVRLVITCALWPQAQVLDSTTLATPDYVNTISIAEKNYRDPLLNSLLSQIKNLNSERNTRPAAQLVFCIDVRSEQFRRSLEAQGHFQTLGFAGFFGLPVRYKGYDDEQAHDACPVLLKPCHEVCENPATQAQHTIHQHNRGRSLLKLPKIFYQALKYNFSTPFALVEMLGPWLGLRMLARTFTPNLVAQLKHSTQSNLMPSIATRPDLNDISVAQQTNYAEGALRMMGLTENFAPLVVFCGHGSHTTNNAYASALDCGACGGNHGGGNARILAAILNKKDIRNTLAERGLHIPADTLFLAAEHNTTTDQVDLYEETATHTAELLQLKQALAKAQVANTGERCKTFGLLNEKNPVAATLHRSQDWAQPRPEWGLAGNAAFIVGPRKLTSSINLAGRSFLHSYDWQNDSDGKFLQTILTAPMVVAQWINNQYLFSTLDNIAYGGGSKVTKNITGKIGIMQGNASDLMHGLPLQSVYITDTQPYHQPLRLLTVVYAPRQRVQTLIEKNPVLQKLFYNGWVNLAVIDPQDQQSYLLKRNGSWQIHSE
jgi:uncharacterized protein YbcC (UPF0753/DUF2309 family)